MRAHPVATPPAWSAYPAAWATLALELGHALPAAYGDAAAARLFGALAETRAPAPADVAGVLLGQLAPRLLQLGAQRTRHVWTHALRQDLDGHVTSVRFGQPAAWHEGRAASSVPPDAFASLPWLAGELTDNASELCSLLGASAVQLAYLAARGAHDEVHTLAMAMGATLLVGLVLQRVLAPIQARQHTRTDEAHRAYGQLRHAYFDNVVLGNASNRGRWQNAYACAAHALGRSHDVVAAGEGAAQFFAQLAGVGVLVWRASGPVGGQKAAEAWPLLLPAARRAAGALGASGRLQAGVQRLRQQSGRYTARLLQLDAPVALVPAERVGAQLAVAELSGRRPDGARPWTDVTPTPGRTRFSGPQGAGKTMALLALKGVLGEAAVYLPPHHDLMFDLGPGSSGQRAKGSLLRLQQDLRHAPGVTHVLLDGWDSNLDGANEAELDALLDRLAETHRVVEVRRARADFAPSTGAEAEVRP